MSGHVGVHVRSSSSREKVVYSSWLSLVGEFGRSGRSS